MGVRDIHEKTHFTGGYLPTRRGGTPPWKDTYIHGSVFHPWAQYVVHGSEKSTGTMQHGKATGTLVGLYIHTAFTMISTHTDPTHVFFMYRQAEDFRWQIDICRIVGRRAAHKISIRHCGSIAVSHQCRPELPSLVLFGCSVLDVWKVFLTATIFASVFLFLSRPYGSSNLQSDRYSICRSYYLSKRF